MNEDVARLVSAGSVGMTVFGVGIAILFATRESRVRPRMDILMLGVSVAAILAMAAATEVHTNQTLATLAAAIGILLGFLQGERLNIRVDNGRALARRSAYSLAAWGAGLTITQSAGIASRTQAMEMGQAVSYFGAGIALGLVLGRQGALKRTLAGSGGTAAALVLLAVLAAGMNSVVPTSAAAQSPEVVTVTATVDPGALVALLQKSFDPGVKAGKSELAITFPSAGGTVSGSGLAVVDNFHLGRLVAIMQGIGSAVGDAVTGSGSTSNDSVTVRPELANCRAKYVARIEVTGSFNATAGTMNGSGTVALALAEPTGCPAEFKDIAAAELSRTPGTWKGTFDGQTLRGTISFAADSSNTATLPFSAKVAAREPATPTAVSAAAGSASGAGPAEPTGDGGDASRDPSFGNDPDEKVSKGEAAAAGILGAIAAAVAAGIAAVGSAGATASGVAVGLSGAVGAAPPEPGLAPNREQPPEPGGPQPGDITPENLATAAENIIRRANTLGQTGIAGRVESLVATGELTPEQAERFRKALKRREELAAWMASDGLYTKSDAQVFAEGAQEGLANVADRLGQQGIGMVIRNPATATRIAAAIGTGGTSEIVFTGLEIANKIHTAATSPGENISNTGAGIEITTIVGWEVGKEVVLDRLGGKIAEGLGEAGKRLAPGLFGDGATAASKAIPLANSLDDTAGALAKSGDTAGGALARSGDDAAEAATKSAPRSPSASPDLPSRPPGVDDAAESGVRGADRAVPTKPAAEAPSAPGAASQTVESSGRPAGPKAPDDAVGASPKPGATAPEPGDGSLPRAPEVAKPVPDLGPSPTPKVEPVPSKVDNTWLKEAPHGSKIPPERLDETGWSQRQREELQRVAGEEDAAIGARITNPDSLAHPTAKPKPELVKGKTVIPEDIPLGARDSDRGLAATLPPKHPGDNAPPAVLERYHERLTEWNQTAEKLGDLRAKGVHWDPNTGLFTDADGVPFRGDIDLVYLRDRKTGELITGERYDRIVAKLRESGVQVQHGAETGAVRDIANAGGDVDKAIKLHEKLSAAHEAGAETVIETTAEGFQKGPSPVEWFDKLTPHQNPLSRGLPMELPDD